MSGRPYTYSRAMAIAQLMIDHRRPAIKKAAAENNLRQVYIHGDDLFVTYSDTIDWVPKLSRLTDEGREAMYISWPGHEIKPIEGWPSEEEIEAEIAASAEREKNWDGSLSANDLTAITRLAGELK